MCHLMINHREGRTVIKIRIGQPAGDTPRRKQTLLTQNPVRKNDLVNRADAVISPDQNLIAAGLRSCQQASQKSGQDSQLAFHGLCLIWTDFLLAIIHMWQIDRQEIRLVLLHDSFRGRTNPGS